jgi:hypothetical protein
MKRKLTIITLLLALATGFAQQPTNEPPPTFIRGTMSINYQSRVTPSLPDIYTLDINVNDSVHFNGYITNYQIMVERGTFSDTILRNALLAYSVDLSIVDPKSKEPMKIGRLFGRAPISTNGVYNFKNGPKVYAAAIKRAPEYNSSFGGLAIGKPLYKPRDWKEDVKRELKMTKNTKGHTASVVVTNYDILTLQGHTVAGGPVPIYPDATFDGKMVYDDDRKVWHFPAMNVAYVQDVQGQGIRYQDRMSGSVRWIEGARNGNTRPGYYDFDWRINEPLADEAAATAGAVDEAAYFDTDTTIPALLGTMKYVDTFSGSKVVRSAVTIDLKGNRLSKQRVMYLAKLLNFTAPIPFNSE